MIIEDIMKTIELNKTIDADSYVVNAFRPYSGTRMKIYGKEFRLINDDTVEAVVEDPTGVVRA